MSEILNRLKQAEAERERVIAERRRLEAEADAALAAREREERVEAQERAGRPVAPPRQAAAQPQPEREPRPRFAAALAIGAAMGVVFWIGTLVPQQRTEPAVKQAAAPEVRPILPAKAPPPDLFRMDADVDGFAARLKDKP